MVQTVTYKNHKLEIIFSLPSYYEYLRVIETWARLTSGLGECSSINNRANAAEGNG
jgi:hypothetical protein